LTPPKPPPSPPLSPPRQPFGSILFLPFFPPEQSPPPSLSIPPALFVCFPGVSPSPPPIPRHSPLSPSESQRFKSLSKQTTSSPLESQTFANPRGRAHSSLLLLFSLPVWPVYSLSSRPIPFPVPLPHTYPQLYLSPGNTYVPAS